MLPAALCLMSSGFASHPITTQSSRQVASRATVLIASEEVDIKELTRDAAKTINEAAKTRVAAASVQNQQRARKRAKVISPYADSPFDSSDFAKLLPGALSFFGPLQSGFFDPLDFATNKTKGKILFYREVELKHGRIAMLASVGFLVAENWHPLWGGTVDVPSYVAFQSTPLQVFWPAVVSVIAFLEIFSVFSFQSPFQPEYGSDALPELWTMSAEHEPGNLDFDPLELRPSDPAALPHS